MILSEIDNLPLHERIYRFLLGNALIDREQTFATEYLGMSKSYLSSRRYSGHEPSVIAFTNLKSALESLQEQNMHKQTHAQLNRFIYEIDNRLCSSL